MKGRSKTKKQLEKDSIRYSIEKIKKCGSCKHLFNGKCLFHNVAAHAGESSCFAYAPAVNQQPAGQE